MSHFYRVSELFSSLQGESTYAGLPCFFIRLSGCNLRCSYCDTLYAREHNARDCSLTLEQLCASVQDSGLKIVELTGGEPLCTPHVDVLAQALLERSFTVLVETNGSLDLNLVPKETIRIMDVKTPSSEMSHLHRYENMELLQPHDEVKFVIQDRLDFLFSCDVAARYDLTQRVHAVHFSPNTAVLPPAKLAQWMLEEKCNGIHLHMQLHKIIWPSVERGV